jgi:hypothetical protein
MYSDVDCPYCGVGQEICHDDGAGYEEDATHEQECGDCEKVFVFTTSISFSYEAARADCLNGEKHKWERTHTWPKEFAKLRCSVCDATKPCPDNFKDICK